MSEWLAVLRIIVAMFLVILVGWLARRRAYLSGETTGLLSRFVVDITIPALIFTQMIRTVDLAALRESWYLPLLSGFVLVVGQLVGMAVAPLVPRRDQRPTFIFLVAIANWVYLPLPIAQELYHDQGVRAILLFNVGAQLVLWTMGVWTIRGGKPDRESFRQLLTNPGLLATAAGIGAALLFPGLRGVMAANVASLPPAAFISSNLLYALELLGSLTIPLSLVVTGAQLGGLHIAVHQPDRTLGAVLVARLLLTPLVTVALVLLAARLGLRMHDEVTRMTMYLVACMPVAISCSMFTDRFGGDTPLAARAIFLSTLLSILTVPTLLYVIQRFQW